MIIEKYVTLKNDKKEHLTADNKWTKDLDKAKKFSSAKEAKEYAKENGINIGKKIVLKNKEGEFLGKGGKYVKEEKDSLKFNSIARAKQQKDLEFIRKHAASMGIKIKNLK